jgi:hypothetical protein
VNDWSVYRNGIWMGHVMAVETVGAAVEQMKSRCRASLRDGAWVALAADPAHQPGDATGSAP